MSYPNDGRYRLFASNDVVRTVQAVASDPQGEDDLVVTFTGPNAEARAQEYINWRNGLMAPADPAGYARSVVPPVIG